jgi:predicted oxidoreductase
MVDTPEQRRMGIKDSHELAMQDWLGSATFDRDVDDPAGPDFWGRQWATAYVDFAAGEKRSWLHSQGMRWIPVAGWAERGGYLAEGHGNSVPRFHLTWGTGPGVVAPFERRVRDAVTKGLVQFRFRHRVDEVLTTVGGVDGVRGAVLEPSGAQRGKRSSQIEVGEFGLRAPAVLVTAGGIGANHDLVQANWPARLGSAPKRMISGVPEHVDGRMLAITEKAGGRLVNRDHMWHYTEGILNWNPIWARHGIRIIPGPSSMWFDALGQRFPAPVTCPPTFSKYTSIPSGTAAWSWSAKSGARWSTAASKPNSSSRARHFSGPPAMPTARAPLSLATWPTTEPTGPVAAATTTVSPGCGRPICNSPA